MSKEISPAEFYVLKCIHELGEPDIPQIVEHLRQQEEGKGKEWAYNTILTNVASLLKKGYITRKKQGRGHIYTPKHSIREIVDQILHRFFGASTKSILANYLFDLDTFTPQDRKKLEKMQKDLGNE